MYEKPVIYVNDDFMEAVFMDSGCYTATAYIHQTPQTGRGDYRLQVNGYHNANHTCEKQTLTITFNQPVEYSWSNGRLISGSGTQTLIIEFHYHQNPTDNIGLGDLVVTSNPGLAVMNVKITD